MVEAELKAILASSRNAATNNALGRGHVILVEAAPAARTTMQGRVLEVCFAAVGGTQVTVRLAVLARANVARTTNAAGLFDPVLEARVAATSAVRGGVHQVGLAAVGGVGLGDLAVTIAGQAIVDAAAPLATVCLFDKGQLRAVVRTGAAALGRAGQVDLAAIEWVRVAVFVARTTL